MGQIGQYKNRAVAYNLGYSRDRVYDLKVTDAVNRDLIGRMRLLFDLIPLDGDTRRQAPKSDPRYYYRPWKTILVRTVADGGESFYVQGDHRVTVPHLRRAALDAESAQ